MGGSFSRYSADTGSDTEPQVATSIRPSNSTMSSQPPRVQGQPFDESCKPKFTPEYQPRILGTSSKRNPKMDKDQSKIPDNELPLTLDDCINLFKTVHKAGNVDSVISAINKALETIENKSKQDKQRRLAETEKTEKSGLWTSLLKGGSAFLEFVSRHIQRGLEKGDFVSQLGETRKPVTAILQGVGKVHWIVGGLAIVAYLLDQIDQMQENRTQILELLRQMVKLAGHIRQLNYEMPQYEKKFNEAIFLIVEGSMMCASQLNSKALFRFLKSSVNSKSLGDLQSKINQLYQDLTLTAVIELNHQLPITAPPSQPTYPDYAVGIEQQIHQLMQLLNMTTTQKSSRAVVIYGFGGIGKTTLAQAVVAKSNTILKDYNYCGVEINEDPSKKDFKRLQQKILNDAFPKYYGKQVIIRDCADGRYHLMQAFISEANKPAFIYIDNVLRADYLKELLPENLHCLPKHSRMLVTTRNLGVTDVLEEHGLQRHTYRVNSLPPENAKKILCNDPSNLHYIKNDMDRIVRICNGIPLVLKIVGVRLKKQGYKAENCTQILEALEKGKKIKEENLSDRLVDFIYNEFEASTQEAFLDICSFFSNWDLHHVQYIVGSEEVTSLEEAALVKSSDENKLEVHDVIMAKGRNMSRSNRIVDLQSLSNIYHQNLKEIRAVWLMEDESAYLLDVALLNSMKDSLRVLSLGNQIRVSEQSQKMFEELRFLRIGGNIPCLPMNLQKLDRLAVFHGPIFKEGFSLHQLPKTLQVVKAMEQSDWNRYPHSKASKSMQIHKNSSLKELDLKELKNLQRLPDGLDRLMALQTLILDDWDKMEVLPKQVCGLPSLSKLSICGGNSLRDLSELFGQLSSLKDLNLTSCRALKKLPSSFGRLGSLKDLNLAECTELKELPFSFGQLRSLETLNLRSCWKLEALPSTFGQLGCLKKLNLRSDQLKELPSSFGQLGNLTELRCNCKELIELPSTFGYLKSLKILDLTCCTMLRSLPSNFGQLGFLEDLNLFACFKLEELPSNVGNLKSLKKMDLRSCDSLRQIPSCLKSKDLPLLLPDGLRSSSTSFK
ncbi:hypothetical protein KI387_035694 [Taxus chinensis]|uniref:NB-ARC domain-containing protein n=1 Tax=Taxus chinensis TaxID=29808 RepID=A0AA38FRU9_TAXCH|nr:hypothetical protein KI387_035694 [Taxus chinensis]